MQGNITNVQKTLGLQQMNGFNPMMPASGNVQGISSLNSSVSHYPNNYIQLNVLGNSGKGMGNGAIMIGTGGNNRTRKYRHHTTTISDIPMNTNTPASQIDQLTRMNDEILNKLENWNFGTALDVKDINTFVGNLNEMLQLSSLLTESTLPFYSNRLEMICTLNYNPTVQMPIGLNFSDTNHL